MIWSRAWRMGMENPKIKKMLLIRLSCLKKVLIMVKVKKIS